MATSKGARPLPMSFKAALTALSALTLLSCGVFESEIQRPTGTLDFAPDRPEVLAQDTAVAYTGNNEFVLDAIAQHQTGLDLHRNVIIRTCGPTGGVCHNKKEYPDLHTPANFLDAIGAPCQVQPGDWSAVYDGCERPGDRLRLDDGQSEIGHIEYIPGDYVDYEEQGQPDAESAGLHIYLQEPVNGGGDRGRTWDSARFIRSFVNGTGSVEELTYARYETRWWFLDNGAHLFGEVREYQIDRVADLLDAGIEQGDMNRNGVFGAREGKQLSLLHPGDPQKSYLIGRLRGELAGDKIPGTRMPLANEPLTVADMLALFCFVEGLSADADGVRDLTSSIDYENCSWSTDPEGLNLLGNGATWLGRVKPLLEANCGGCHGGQEPQGELDLLAEGTYERLLEASKQQTDMPLITPMDPANSYLWLKLIDMDGIVGQGMPVDPLEGVRKLPEGALNDIETWIMNGAAREE